MLYGAVMALTGVSFSWMRYCVFFVGQLHHEAIDRTLIKRAMMKSVLNPLLHTAAILLALVNTRMAIGLYVAIPILFFVPTSLERQVSTSKVGA
jgi:hypothetical protein